MFIQLVDEQNKVTNIFKHQILDGPENWMYKYFIQTFSAMPVISNAYLVKGKNELIVVKNEELIEKWEISESSYAKITHLGSSVCEIVCSRLLLDKEF